jgi:hypothetical protein
VATKVEIVVEERPRYREYQEMVAPLFGVELAHASESVEVEGDETVNDPGAVGAVATCTLVVAVLVPFAFVAVRVKTVVEVGFTEVDPMRVDVLKEPGLTVTEEAFVMFQESVLVPAEATTPGEAVNAVIEGVMPESVVADALVDDAEIFPTLSCASTYQKYVVEVARPESEYVRRVVVAMSGMVEVEIPR